MSIEAMKQALEALNCLLTEPMATTAANKAELLLMQAAPGLRKAIKQAEQAQPAANNTHWCTYCNGHNAHNCQFNTQLPRIQTYTTDNTSPPHRQPLTDEQDEFEKVFKRPAECERFNGGYAPTQHSAWGAQAFCDRWEGWKARAAHDNKEGCAA